MARARRKRSAPPALPSEVTAPPELRDPHATVWHDQRAYNQFMKRHGWRMPPAERMGHATAPSNRRQAASAGWARDNAITAQGHSGADPHRLRAWGLID